MKLIILSPSFFSLLIGHSAIICLIQKNRQVKSSLRPDKKDTVLPPTSWSYTWQIRPQDHVVLLSHYCLLLIFPHKMKKKFKWGVCFHFVQSSQVVPCQGQMKGCWGKLNPIWSFQINLNEEGDFCHKNKQRGEIGTSLSCWLLLLGDFN